MICDKCKKKIDTYPCYICGYEGKESEKQVSSFSFTDIIDQVFHPPYQDDSKKELLIIFLSCVIGFIIFLANLLFFKGKNLTLMASYGINPYVQLLVAIVFGTFFYYHRKVSCLTSSLLTTQSLPVTRRSIRRHTITCPLSNSHIDRNLKRIGNSRSFFISILFSLLFHEVDSEFRVVLEYACEILRIEERFREIDVLLLYEAEHLLDSLLRYIKL